jgi:hypothetical protein
MNTPRLDDTKLEFFDIIPYNFVGNPIPISGSTTGRYRTFLRQTVNGVTINDFEIRYDYKCSPFNKAQIDQELLAVGYEGYIFLYDLAFRVNLLSMELCGYFDKLYWYQGILIVTDSSYVYRIDRKGNLVWRSGRLGIDGVFLERFEHDKAFGSAQHDPPDGWHDFVIDLESGSAICSDGG